MQTLVDPDQLVSKLSDLYSQVGCDSELLDVSGYNGYEIVTLNINYQMLRLFQSSLEGCRGRGRQGDGAVGGDQGGERQDGEEGGLRIQEEEGTSHK